MALEPITRQEQIIAGKDLEPITRMEKFLKQYGGGGGGGTGADWAQNDETKPDYIKNRTHWMEPGIVTIFPEQTCVGKYEELDEDFGIHYWYPEEEPVFAYPLVEGKTYTVTFDGITYECVAFDDINGIYIGDLNVFYGESNPDFPFLFQGTSTYLMDNIPHTISCTLDDYIYHKLPPEYLANGLNRIIVHEDTEMTIEQANKYHELLAGGHINLIWGDLCIKYIYCEEKDDNGIWTVKNLALNTRGFTYIINITDDFVFPYKGLRLRKMHIISDLDEHKHGFNINMKDEILTIGPYSYTSAPATEKVLFCVEPDGSKNSQNFEVLGNGTIKTRSVILPSTTAGSKKKFRITVDDSGTISATEVT